MAIYVHFPDAADSPTGRTPVRLRYALERRQGRMQPVLRYAHGTAELTPDRWSLWRAGGAYWTAGSERERQIANEVLSE